MSASRERQVRAAQAGTVLFRQGDVGGEMYVILDGKVEVSRRVGDRQTVLAVLPAGEFFGEMAIINNRPRSATATVTEDAQLLVLDSETLSGMIRDNAEIAVRLIKKLSFRLEQANRQMELLMYRDPNSRVVHCLRQMAEGGDAEPDASGLRVNISAAGLAEHLGLSVDEVNVVVGRLQRARLVQVLQDGTFVISEVGKLHDFLDFLDMKERFG